MTIILILKGNYHISLMCHSKYIILVLKATNKPLGHFLKTQECILFSIKINIIGNTIILMITHKNYIIPKMQIIY